MVSLARQLSRNGMGNDPFVDAAALALGRVERVRRRTGAGGRRNGFLGLSLNEYSIPSDLIG